MSDTPIAPDAPAPARRRPTRTVLAVTAGAAAIALGVGGFLTTTAAFTDQETVTGNSVSTATLSIGDTIATPVKLAGLLPGQTADAQQVLSFANDGTVAFDYTVTLTNIQAGTGAPTELLGWIPVTITVPGDGGTSKTGTLAAPPTIPAQNLDVNGKRTVLVTVGLSDQAGNTAQNKTASFDVVVTATQK